MLNVPAFVTTISTVATAAFAFPTATFPNEADDSSIRVMVSQAPTILNPYMSAGSKDIEAASIVLEPLAGYDPEGALQPRLAAALPTLKNGGINDAGTSITWQLNPEVTWSDGSPVTAEDVVFTWQYCTHPEMGCSQSHRFEGVSTVIAEDPQTVTIHFSEPRATPHAVFVGAETPILQRDQFSECLGVAAPQCVTENAYPTGTGPYTVEDFAAGDQVVFEANPAYREESKPRFETVSFRGATDAVAASTVIRTGEADFAPSLSLPADVLRDWQDESDSRLEIAYGTQVEILMINNGLPGVEEAYAPHPALALPAVVEALGLAIERSVLADISYGPAAIPTCYWIPSPAEFVPDGDCPEQDLDRARVLLDDAGVVDRDGDGIREFDGKPVALVLQTSAGSVRGDMAVVLKSWWNEIGIDTEIRTVPPQVLFGGDPDNRLTLQRFEADIQLFAGAYSGRDPEAFLAGATCQNIPTPDSQWQGQNLARFCDPDYDAAVQELQSTMDTEKRASIIRHLNKIASTEGMVIPLMQRGTVAAISDRIAGVIPNPWDTPYWNIEEWHLAD